MSHIIVIGKAKECIDILQRVINVASAGGAHVHAELSGYEDVETKLDALNAAMPGCVNDLTSHVETLEGMLPSTGE